MTLDLSACFACTACAGFTHLSLMYRHAPIACSAYRMLVVIILLHVEREGSARRREVRGHAVRVAARTTVWEGFDFEPRTSFEGD